MTGNPFFGRTTVKAAKEATKELNLGININRLNELHKVDPRDIPTRICRAKKIKIHS